MTCMFVVLGAGRLAASPWRLRGHGHVAGQDSHGHVALQSLRSQPRPSEAAPPTGWLPSIGRDMPSMPSRHPPHHTASFMDNRRTA